MEDAVIAGAVTAGLALVGYIIKKSKNKTDDKIFGVIKNIFGRK